MGFEIICQNKSSLRPTKNELPHTRLNLLQALDSKGISNLTKLEFYIPYGQEAQSVMNVLGKIIRRSPKLEVLSLSALKPPHYSFPLSTGLQPPFPPIRELYLMNVVDEYTWNQHEWEELIPWSEIVTFSSTCNSFVGSVKMPKLKRLALLKSNDGFDEDRIREYLSRDTVWNVLYQVFDQLVYPG